MHNPKFLYPRFYVKSAGGTFAVTHRLTHSYITSAKTEKELVEEIKKLNSMEEEELLRYLIYDKRVRIPSAKDSVLSKKTKENDEAEEWFRNAWSVYTDLFYTQNPKLLVEEKELPHRVILKIRKEQYEAEKVKEEKRRDELREAERLSKLDETTQKKLKRVEKAEPTIGKIGVPASLERMKVKKKVKKLKIKTKSNMVVDLIDDDDPFA